MTVPVTNNPQTSNTAALTSYALTGGSDRILVVEVGSENAGNATPFPATSVTFGAVSMTKVTSSDATRVNTTINTWYLLEADFPGTETQDITASFATEPARYVISARTLTGAEQQAPSAVQTATQGASSPINTAITTVDNDSLVTDGVHASRINTLTKTQAAQVTDATRTTSTSNQGLSHSPQATAGSITLGWSAGSPERFVHSLTAWSPAAVAGAIMNQLQAGNVGADLYNGTIL